MNERDLAVLEQYDLTVNDIRRGRGSYICTTDRGRLLLQEYRGSEVRAQSQYALMLRLREGGCANIDLPVFNREGCIVSKTKDGTGFLLKEYMDGRECDVRSRDELAEAAQNLAHIHLLMRIPQSEAAYSPDKKEQPADAAAKSLPAETKAARPLDQPSVYAPPRFADSAARHNREMKRVRNFLRSKKNKTDFERYVLQYFSMFYETGIRVQEALTDAAFTEMEERALREGQWRHGEYTQHNVLFTSRGTATVNFEHCAPQLQLEDVALFLRKIMEKYDWDITLGDALLAHYSRIAPLSKRALGYLSLRLAYPEKYWKLLNRYYNVSKSWVNGRSCDRLVLLAAQEEKKKAFVKSLL